MLNSHYNPRPTLTAMYAGPILEQLKDALAKAQNEKAKEHLRNEIERLTALYN